MKLLIASSFLIAAALSGAQSTRVAAYSMVFSSTDVSKALRAVSLRTGTGIVYAGGKEKLTVSLDVTVSTSEEAVRCIASAAGLAYRKVGTLYVVAPPSGMRQALEPYGQRVSFAPASGNMPDLAAKLQELLPHSTIRAAGDRIAMVGVAEDIASARETLQDMERQYASEGVTMDVVLLRQSPATQIAPLITALYPAVKVTPTPGAKGGAIALSGPKSQIEAARATVEKLDGSMLAEETVFKVYNLRYASATAMTEFLKQAAPTVQAIAGPESFIPGRATFKPLTAMMSGGGYFGGTSGSSDGGGIKESGGSSDQASTGQVVGDRSKTMVLKGLAAEVDAALELLAKVDTKPKQIVVEVNVIETSPEDNEEIGLKYSWDPFNFSESAPGIGGGGSRPAGLGQFSRTPLNFRAILSAMVVRKEARILAKPRIHVIDNGQASVFVGDTIRARIVTGGALGAQNVDIKEFPVGIILLIAPRVNADGNITMHVNPVISTVTSVDEDNIPQTSAREAETTAIVKSGETVMLGGLIRDQDIKTIQEVPLLSKLPLVGQLFRNRSRNRRRSDIMVSITPHLIDDEPVAAAGAKP